MPAANFSEYADDLSTVIMDVVATGQARVFDLQVDQRSAQRGYITGILVFEDNSELHFREFIDTTLSAVQVMYAYHYQDANKELIFRYDNARHRPPLSQQEHKHTPATIEVGPMPTLLEAIDEVISMLQ